MMRLPLFQFVAPTSLVAAVHALADAGPSATVVAGGTDLYPNMKRRQVQPHVVVGLQDIPELAEIRAATDGGLLIGAGVTLTQLERHPLIRKHYAGLAETVLTISTPLLRNMGTVGGNLCLDTRCHYLNQTHFWRKALGSCMKAEGDICRVAPGSPRCWAITSADLPPLLIALGASVRLTGPAGERTLPLLDLYADDGINYLAKARDEILVELILPPLDGTRAAYLKLRRRGTFDFPALGVAAALRIDPDGGCTAARIVLGAVTSRPLDMPQATMLVGGRITPDAIQAVADELLRKARPLHLADYTHSYRKKMVGLYTKRVLEQLMVENHG